MTVRAATGWTFGEIPESVQRVVNGIPVSGYPALADRGRAVDLVVLPDSDEAARTHLRGVRRLVALRVPNPGPRRVRAWT